mmetsp:Transcript_140843/g.392582  ORF Transcript_140843/g.392582 Transcript_140843/m.392582 type:complete len:259 (+) Transcript_140843:582-1358(+)
MYLWDAWTIRIIHIFLECLHQQQQFKAEAHQSPVLKHKACKEGLPLANVAHVLHSKYIHCCNFFLIIIIIIVLLFFLGAFLCTINVITILLLCLNILLCLIPFLCVHVLIALLLLYCVLVLGRLSIRCLLLLLLLHLLLFLFFLPSLLLLLNPEPSCLFSRGVLPELLLFQLPLLQDFLPLCQLREEPLGWMQVFYFCSAFLLEDPLPQISLTSAFILPFKVDRIEALIQIRNGKIGKGRIHNGWRHIANWQWLKPRF